LLSPRSIKGWGFNVPLRDALRISRRPSRWVLANHGARPDWPTPLGSYRIASLSLNPTWHVPPSIRAELEDEGLATSTQVKSGPGNPLFVSMINLTLARRVILSGFSANLAE
jgi:hypothetical protein